MFLLGRRKNKIMEKISPFSFTEIINPDYSKIQKYSKKLITELCGVPVYKLPELGFTPNPNQRIGNIFKLIECAHSKIGVYARLITLSGFTPALWLLLTKGITSGLSGGTMDIIYRIGIPNNVIGLLDNIDIAVGSFQRRFQIVEILMEQLLTDEFEQLFSIAGGSGIIPIEAIIKSRKKIRLINIDRSEKALKKMKVILAQIKKADCLIIPQYIKADISNIVNINALSDSSKIIECTGYLEYLNMNEKSLFLKDIERILNNKDNTFAKNELSK